MNKIKSLRLAAELTQFDLAEKLNVAQNTVSAWELGKSEPDIGMLKKIAKFFKVSVGDIVGEEDEKNKLNLDSPDSGIALRTGNYSSDYEEHLKQFQKIRFAGQESELAKLRGIAVDLNYENLKYLIKQASYLRTEQEEENKEK